MYKTSHFLGIVIVFVICNHVSCRPGWRPSCKNEMEKKEKELLRMMSTTTPIPPTDTTTMTQTSSKSTTVNIEVTTVVQSSTTKNYSVILPKDCEPEEGNNRVMEKQGCGENGFQKYIGNECPILCRDDCPRRQLFRQVKVRPYSSAELHGFNIPREGSTLIIKALNRETKAYYLYKDLLPLNFNFLASNVNATEAPTDGTPTRIEACGKVEDVHPIFGDSAIALRVYNMGPNPDTYTITLSNACCAVGTFGAVLEMQC